MEGAEESDIPVAALNSVELFSFRLFEEDGGVAKSRVVVDAVFVVVFVVVVFRTSLHLSQ